MPRGKLDAPNEYLGNEDAFHVDDIGKGKIGIETIDQVVNDDFLATEQFMQEPVTVMVHDSNDPNDIDLVQVMVNGVSQFFMRGQPITVKRMFIERLARAKRTSYSQNLDERLGESMNQMMPRHALKYPFSVIEDKNPKGGAWLRGILASRS